MITVTKRFSFEAAHHLPNHEGKCRNVHGHEYFLEVEVFRPLNQLPGASKGMVIDFGELKDTVNKLVIEPLDHKDLNTIFENPTAEMMLLDIVFRLQQAFEAFGVKLIRVRLQETSNAWAEWKA